MNFVLDFEFDSHLRPMMGDDANEAVAKSRYALLESDFPKNPDTFDIIKEFANNQQLWAQAFFEGWEKMQNNVHDYDLVEDQTKITWLGNSFLEKESFDTLTYPLTFTDNDKANPRFFARTKLPGQFRLSFIDFRKLCQMTQTGDDVWVKNDLGPDYNPCPPELMDYSCPVDGCDQDKCSIHWSLCK